MIRMTRMTDYGIVLLTHCARQKDRPIHTARDLAAESHLPLPTVGKILKALARAGLLASHRGVNGGYALARRPESISVAEIITALEGPVAITECSGEVHDDRCELERMCPVRSNWQRINDVVWEALSRISLAELTRPLPPRLVALGSPATSTPKSLS